MPTPIGPPPQPESASNPEPNPKRRRLTTMGPPPVPTRNANPYVLNTSTNPVPDTATQQPFNPVPNSSGGQASSSRDASQVRRTNTLQVPNLDARQAPNPNAQVSNANAQPPTDSLPHRLPFQNILAPHHVPNNQRIILPRPVPSATPSAIPTANPFPFIFLPLTAAGAGLHESHAEPKPKNRRKLDYKVPELTYPPPFPIWFPSIETVPELASSYASGEDKYTGIQAIGICRVDNPPRIGGFHWALLFLAEELGMRVEFSNGRWMDLVRPNHRYGWMLDPCAGYRSDSFVQFLDSKALDMRLKTDTRMTFRLTTAILYRLCIVGVMTSIAISQKGDQLCRSVTTAKDMYDLEASTRAWCIYVIIGLPGVVEHHGFEPEGPAQGMCWRIEYDMRLVTLAELGRAHKLYDNQAFVNPGFVNNCKECNYHLRRL